MSWIGSASRPAHGFSLRLCWVWLCFLGLLMGDVLAGEPGKLRVETGFGEATKVGCWTAVRAVAAGLEAISAEIEAIDPDGVRTAYALVREDRNGSDVAFRGVFRPGRLDADWIVRVFDRSGNVVAEQRVSARPEAIQRALIAKQSNKIWAEIGFESPVLESTDRWPLLRVAELPKLWQKDPRRSLAADELLVFDSREWPENAKSLWACDGLNGILLSSRTTLGPEAEAELIRWVRRGGHLVLVISGESRSFEVSPLAKWLEPTVRIRERTRTTDFSGVEGFTVQSRRIRVSAPVPVLILDARQGRNLISSKQGALVTQSAVGFGLVTVCGLDLTRPPLASWEARPAFLKRLLLQNAEAADLEDKQEVARLSQTGISDLSSQWRAAAIQMPGIERPSLWEVLGWLLLYAVVIGPLDFVLVHKLFRRPHWTWWTLPAWVLVASLGTVWYAQGANGDAEPLTQLDLLDIDVSTQEVRSQSWATTYSNENRLWKVESRPNATLPGAASGRPDAIVSWLGFPEAAAGGLYRPSGLDLGRTVARTNADHTRWEHIPIGRWASKSMTAEATWVPAEPLIEANFNSPFSSDLKGSMVHHFPVALEDWLLIYEDRVFRPDPRLGTEATRWEPEIPWKPDDKQVNSRVLRGYLTRAKAIKVKSNKKYISEDVLYEQDRYSPLNLEPADILQMLTLHEAAGGKTYTGLDHFGLGRLELTSRLTLGRALLVARLAKPTTEWVLDGASRSPAHSHSFVRALLPVTRGESANSFRVLPKHDEVELPGLVNPADSDRTPENEKPTKDDKPLENEKPKSESPASSKPETK